MITCNLMGGLGNQLFQIFATIAYGIKAQNQFKFLNIEKLGGGSTTIRYTYWNSFLSNLKPFLTNIFPNVYVIKEKGFEYKPINIYELVQKDVMIYGYFQSYKYFQEHFGTICRIIGIKKMKDELLTKLNLNEEYFNNTISLHFRLGDYKKIPDFHPIMTYEYYERSINYIKQHTDINNKFNILYFCEDDDLQEVLITINELKNKFYDYSFVRADNSLADWEQMLLMSSCHHNIIANSSFSWWGAYFNSWPISDKIVCYPSVWFGTASKNNTKDLCPPEWVKIGIY